MIKIASAFSENKKKKMSRDIPVNKIQNTQMKHSVAKIPGVDKLSRWSQMCLPHNSIYFSRIKKKKNGDQSTP